MEWIKLLTQKTIEFISKLQMDSKNQHILTTVLVVSVFIISNTIKLTVFEKKLV